MLTHTLAAHSRRSLRFQHQPLPSPTSLSILYPRSLSSRLVFWLLFCAWFCALRLLWCAGAVIFGDLPLQLTTNMFQNIFPTIDVKLFVRAGYGSESEGDEEAATVTLSSDIGLVNRASTKSAVWVTKASSSRNVINMNAFELGSFFFIDVAGSMLFSVAIQNCFFVCIEPAANLEELAHISYSSYLN
ncbi:hypothetical protein RIF29_21149 [Crotalaria pallida]|uniref:Uncharacterized protein n=1 Tax=Crotalaria pallida TaxID=3830 RepID=A0AAN9ID50_CROPI